jgi:apoptosis-inducing factor 3
MIHGWFPPDSFIGLEVAASLRARDIEVHVAAPGERPLERILGREFGDFIRVIDEGHGVIFHLGQTAAAINGGQSGENRHHVASSAIAGGAKTRTGGTGSVQRSTSTSVVAEVGP